MENTLQNNTFFQSAHSIGRYLAKEAIWYGDKCNWTGAAVEVFDGKFETITKTFGANFYGGLSGIAYFLTKLFLHTQDGIILHTLNGTLNNLTQQIDEEEFVGLYGYYSGKLGAACALVEMGHDLNRSYLVDKGVALIEELEEHDIQDFEIDIISGVAGSIPALLKVYKQNKSVKILKLAEKCGDFLISKAAKENRGWSWETVGNKRGLTGYSHGAAGIAIAFLELFETTQEQKYHEAAFQAFSYESSWFDSNKKNWPDLRVNDGSDGKPLDYMTAWCHGAPGITLSRIKAFELTNDEGFKNEALVALETTYTALLNQVNNLNISSNYSQCHGLAGNADILLRGYEAFKIDKYLVLAQQIGKTGIERYGNTGLDWPSGVSDPSGNTSGQEFTPGLMLGVAGTGYFYLRLSSPSMFKSILFVESEDTSMHKAEKNYSVDQKPLILNDI